MLAPLMGRRRSTFGTALLPVLALLPALAAAHGVSGHDAEFVSSVSGAHPGPFAYLGAKHMVTGYDHLAFLAGVIFLLHRARDVALYVTLFALGHTLTLLGAVLVGWRADAHVIDAIIGLSVVYKGFENIGGLRGFAWRPDPRAAVFAFGLVHGLGLATRVQELQPSDDGLVANLFAFNLGVELGQLAALSVMVLLFTLWRRSRSFDAAIRPANAALMVAGFLLSGYQMAGFLLAT